MRYQKRAHIQSRGPIRDDPDYFKKVFDFLVEKRVIRLTQRQEGDRNFGRYKEYVDLHPYLPFREVPPQASVGPYRDTLET